MHKTILQAVMKTVSVIELYTLTVNQGNAGAQFNLACYRNGIGVNTNMEKAIELFTLSANQGHANAQFNLACSYENGIGVDTNMDKAIELYTLSANQGFHVAQHNLACCYEDGIDVAKKIWRKLLNYIPWLPIKDIALHKL